MGSSNILKVRGGKDPKGFFVGIDEPDGITVNDYLAISNAIQCLLDAMRGTAFKLESLRMTVEYNHSEAPAETKEVRFVSDRINSSTSTV
jgi:hypothetical protein